MLPELNDEGYLPPGIHPATMGEVQVRFVEEAPFPDVRRTIFTGLELYMHVLQSKISHGAIWLDGGCVSHKAWPPKDVDLVVLVEGATLSGLQPDDWQTLFQLVTLQNVRSAQPAVATPWVQPMGGLIDAFIIEASDPASRKLWEGLWSSVTDQSKAVVPHKVKGFVEVEW